MVKIAEITQTVSAQTTTFELYEEGGIALGKTLKIVSDPRRYVGNANGRILDWRLPTEVTFDVKDDDSYLLGLFFKASEGDFRLDIKKGASLYNRLNVVLGSERVQKGITDPVLIIRASDGLPRLQSVNYDVEALQVTYPDGITVAELFQLLLDAIGHEIDVRVYLESAHANQNTTRPNAHGIRWKVEDWLEGEESRTYWDVLQRLCEYYQAQVFQDDGVWMVMERRYRGGPMDYANCAFGGSITKVTADDRQIALGESSLARPAQDIYLQPVPKAISRNVFHQTQLANARFEEWTEGLTQPIGWTVPTGGTPTIHVVGERTGVQLNTSTDAVFQKPTETFPVSERVRFTIEFIDIDYDATFTSGSITAEIGQVILHNAEDGTLRYLQNAGTWTTTATALTASFEAGVITKTVVIEAVMPVTGTLSLFTRFNPNPDAAGNDEFDAWTYGELSYERVFDIERPDNVSYEATSGFDSAEPVVDEEFGVGDFNGLNAGAGVSQYLDATSGNWTKTTDWSTDVGDQPFHTRRTRYRIQQQKERLSGFDGILSPDTVFGISNTLVYTTGLSLRPGRATSSGDVRITSDSDNRGLGEGDFIPVYLEENLKKRTSRVTVYEHQSESANADRIYDPAPAPLFRPLPRYRVDLRYVTEDTFEVWLVVEKDAFSAAVEWEYEVNAVVLESGTTAFGVEYPLEIHVNNSNPLTPTDVTPKVRAWAWSDISGGVGQGLRQAKPFEVELVAFVDGVPSVAYNLLPPEYDGTTGYLYKVSYTSDPDTASVQAKYEQPSGTLLETTNNDGRAGAFTVNAANPLAPGESARIKLRGYAGAGATGTVEVNETIIDVTAPQIQSGEIATGAVISDKLIESARRFGSDIVFSATDFDTVAWAAGSIVLANGTSYSIGAGNTGNMTVLTYIYLDVVTSTTALQTTTVLANATGDRKILVAVAKPAADSAQRAFFVPGVGELGLNEGHLSPLSVSTSILQANSVTAAKISVVSLSAISADMGSLTSGSIVVGTTNKLWLNDAADGALNIGGATKASAPFRVTAAGALTATNATITNTGVSHETSISSGFITCDAVGDSDQATIDSLGFYANKGIKSARLWHSIGLRLDQSGTDKATIDMDGNVMAVGTVKFTGLPTADPTVSGALWNDAGTVKISAG